MAPTSPHDIELAILRTLLAIGGEAAESADMTQTIASLDKRAWRDAEHRVVYRCWRTARRNRAVPLREEMAAQATRMGHPDIEWPTYFQESSSEMSLHDLLRTLDSL